MADLYCVPLGESARSLFYEQICSYDYRDSILVLPNRYLRRQAQLEANVNCTGIDTLANKILNSNGYADFNEINRRSQELITRELIEYLASKGKFAYFDKLVSKKGFIKAAASLVGQLSRSGATEEQITDTLLNWGRTGYDGQKDAEIAQLYSLYRTYLKNENWFDLEGKYRLAIYVLEQEQVKVPWKNIYISDFYSFDVLQLEFLKKLARHCNLHIGLMYEENRPEVFNPVQNTYGYLAGFCRLHKLAAQTERNNDIKHLINNIFSEAAPMPCGNIALHQLNSREEEIRWVLTRVKALLKEQSVPESEILVAVRDLDEYGGIKQIADEYGIPLSLPATGKLIVQPLTEFILLLLKAKQDNREGAEAYFALLASEFGKLIFTDCEKTAYLRNDVYYTSRSNVQIKCRELYGDDALSMVDQFLSALPQEAAINEFTSLLKEFIEQFDLEHRLGLLYKEGKINISGLKSALLTKSELLNCLDSLNADYTNCKMQNNQFNLTEFQEILTDSLNEAELTLTDGRADGVFVTEVVNAQGRNFDYVFIMGLREGEFPAGASENWIYNDKERAELLAYGIDMPNTAQAYAEDAFFFASAISACRKNLLLTWFKDDRAGASAYLESVTKLFANISLQQDCDKKQASIQEVLCQAGDCNAQWLKDKIGTEAYLAAFADLNRKTNNLYNGVIEDSALRTLIKTKAGRVFSASKLEVYAACPFRYLGEQIWKEAGAEEKSELVDPADEGSLLHEVLAEFVGRYLHKKLCGYDFETLQSELWEILDSKIKYADAEMKNDNILWLADLNRLKNILSRWLRAEYREQQLWQDYVPVATEKEFKGQQALAVKLSDGEQIVITGKIDRIDSNGTKVFITDYKRSTAPGTKDLLAGLDLQLPVYLLAAENLYGSDCISGGGYFVLKDAERKGSIAFEPVGSSFKCNEKVYPDADNSWQTFKDEGQKMLQKYASAIYDGNFLTWPAKKCSPYCPLKNICRVNLLAEHRGEDDD